MSAHLIPLAIFVFGVLPVTILTAAVLTSSSVAARLGVDPVFGFLRAHRLLPRRWRAGLVDTDFAEFEKLLSGLPVSASPGGHSSASETGELKEGSASRRPAFAPLGIRFLSDNRTGAGSENSDEKQRRSLTRLVVAGVFTVLTFMFIIPTLVGSGSGDSGAEGTLQLLAPSATPSGVNDELNASGVMPANAVTAVHMRLLSAGAEVTCDEKAITPQTDTSVISDAGVCVSELPNMKVTTSVQDRSVADISVRYI